MMYNGVFFQGKRYDTETLNALSTKELLDIYNRAKGGKPVSRFESHAKALIRTWDALQAVGSRNDVPAPKPAPAKPAPKKPAKTAPKKPATEALLELLRGQPAGMTLDALGVALGVMPDRVRGLIDSARSRHGKGCIVRGDAKATFRIGQE